MNSSFRKLTTFAGLSLAVLASAHATGFTLNSSTATIVGGNEVSSFYQVNKPNEDHVNWWESGSAAGLYSFTQGGNSQNGFWVTISFDGNPQPILDSAFIKAGNFRLTWDANDLKAFNEGIFDSITLIQDGIWNPPHNSLLGISHAGINGRPGVKLVPDTGLTVVLLGLGLTAVSFFARRRRA